jgi:hypothetical protein
LWQVNICVWANFDRHLVVRCNPFLGMGTQKLQVSENSVLRKTFGPVKDGQFRILRNKGLYDLQTIT